MRRILIVAVLAGLASGCSTSIKPSATAGGVVTEVAALVGQAQLRMELGEVVEGIQLYRRAVALAPDDLQLAEEFGLALSRAGMVDEAQEELLRAGDLSPTGAATLGLILSRSASTREDLERAVPYLQRGLDAVPLGSQVRFQLTQALVDLGRGDEAWTALQPLLSDRPGDRRLQVLAGQALRLQGRSDEAIPFFQRAGEGIASEPMATAGLVDALADEGKFAEAAKEWKQLLERQGGTPAGWVRYAALLLRAGDADGARASLGSVLESEPDNADALSLKAVLEASDGNLEEAARLYRRVLDLHPDEPGTAMALARVAMELRSGDEARKLLSGLWNRAAAGDLPEGAALEIAEESAALELIDGQAEAARPWLERLGSGPFDRRAVAMWAEYFRLSKDYAGGLAWFDAAVLAEEPAIGRLTRGVQAEFMLAAGREEPGQTVLADLLGGDVEGVRMGLDVLQRMERWPQAATAARNALERLGESSELRFALAAALERGGQWDEAVTEFRRLLGSDPDNAAALNYLGYMFADRNTNLDEALVMIQRAVELRPRSGAFLDSLGWVHFRLGNMEKARELLLRAAELEPKDPTVHEHLGDLFVVLGDPAEAVERYREALSLESEEEGQRERIEKKLSELGADAVR